MSLKMVKAETIKVKVIREVNNVSAGKAPKYGVSYIKESHEWKGRRENKDAK